MLAALLLEYEVRIVKYLEKEYQRQPVETAKQNIPDVLLKYKAGKQKNKQP